MKNRDISILRKTVASFLPGITVVLKGFIPKLPEVAEGSDNSSMANWKMQKWDAANSAIMMFVLSAAVIITASTTLHTQGQVVRIEIPGGWDIARELMGEKQACLAYYMQEGGTIFGLDHRIPNGTSLENYRYYVNRGREIPGLPPLDGKSKGWGRMAW
ncbi:MAG: hypothetical protein ABFS38_19905 [Bacteroidota bacterium]